MDYRLRGLIPGHNYVIKVRIPENSSRFFNIAIEKALPNNIPITLGKADVTGIDFVVLQRSKKIDIRGYIAYTDEQERCPFEKVENLSVELRKINDDEESSDVTPEVKRIPQTCIFFFVGLERATYEVKVIERQSKTITSVIYSQRLDLNEDREINGGVRTVEVNIQSNKKTYSDSVNTSMYSPIFLFTMIFVIFQWEYVSSTWKYITGLCSRKKVSSNRR